MIDHKEEKLKAQYYGRMLLHAIVLKCVECSGANVETIVSCERKDCCSIHPYRMGYCPTDDLPKPKYPSWNEEEGGEDYE